MFRGNKSAMRVGQASLMWLCLSKWLSLWLVFNYSTRHSSCDSVGAAANAGSTLGLELVSSGPTSPNIFTYIHTTPFLLDQLSIKYTRSSHIQPAIMTTAYPPGGTYFDGRKSFADVETNASTDNAINTTQFLEAAESLTTLFDVIGGAAFKPVKSDMQGNIKVYLHHSEVQ